MPGSSTSLVTEEGAGDWEGNTPTGGEGPSQPLRQPLQASVLLGPTRAPVGTEAEANQGSWCHSCVTSRHNSFPAQPGSCRGHPCLLRVGPEASTPAVPTYPTKPTPTLAGAGGPQQRDVACCPVRGGGSCPRVGPALGTGEQLTGTALGYRGRSPRSLLLSPTADLGEGVHRLWPWSSRGRCSLAPGPTCVLRSRGTPAALVRAGCHLPAASVGPASAQWPPGGWLCRPDWPVAPETGSFLPREAAVSALCSSG